MRNDLTVVYYTSNRENAEFERKIQQTLLETINGLPIISVSQKPVDLGKNVCVGEVGVSAQNAWRQFQIGAMEAKTKFVCSAEDDVLYAPDYFDFVPPVENAWYIAHPMYVLWNLRGKKRAFGLKQQGSESAVIVDREYLIRMIEDMLDGYGMWRKEPEKRGEIPLLFKNCQLEHFETSVPSVTFKTEEDMHRRTFFKKGSIVRDIPYWGNSIELIKRYCS